MSSKKISDYDLVIFDCDGTLVNSEAICNQVLVDLVNQNSPIQYTLDHALDIWAGRTLSNVLESIEEEHSIKFPDDMAHQYVRECNLRYPTDLKIIDGAMDLVKACDSVTKICVGSNGERQNVLDSLNICEFSPTYFKEETIFTRIQVSQGKPAPDIFLFAAETMSVKPERCLVIEDSPAGAQGGVAAGMDVLGFIGVSHLPKEQEKKLLKVGVKAVFSDIIHMREYLGL